MSAWMKNLRRDVTGNILAAVTVIFLALALVFYAPAALRNYSPWVIVLGAAAVILYLLGFFLDLRGADVILGGSDGLRFRVFPRRTAGVHKSSQRQPFGYKCLLLCRRGLFLRSPSAGTDNGLVKEKLDRVQNRALPVK